MNKHILIILIVIAAVMLSSCGEKVSSADNKAIANPVITPPRWQLRPARFGIDSLS